MVETQQNAVWGHTKQPKVVHGLGQKAFWTPPDKVLRVLEGDRIVSVAAPTLRVAERRARAVLARGPI